MCSLNLRVPQEILLSESDLVSRLSQDDPTPPGFTDIPQFLYRGQPCRYERTWPPEALAGTPADTYVDFDSIIPNDYRDMEAGLRAIAHGKAPPGKLQCIQAAYGDPVAHLRSILTIHAARQRAQTSGDVALIRWVDNTLAHTTVTPNIHNLLSVGQHYGFKTHYLDATSAWPVALVFATRHWTGLPAGTYMPSGKSVIYRIDYALLESVQTSFNMRHAESRCRAIDIRLTPPQLAPRASGQHGWSLIGFESPYFLSDLINAGAIRAFLFQRTGSSPQNIDALFNQMKPSADPFVSHIELYRTPGPWIQHVQKRFGSRFTPINLKDHKWRLEIYAPLRGE